MLPLQKLYEDYLVHLLACPTLLAGVVRPVWRGVPVEPAERVYVMGFGGGGKG